MDEEEIALRRKLIESVAAELLMKDCEDRDLDNWYECKKCGFVFARHAKVETCVDCGSPLIIDASEDVVKEHLQKLEEDRKELGK